MFLDDGCCARRVDGGQGNGERGPFAEETGYGDVAIMWKGVAHNYLDAIEIVPAPYEYEEDVRVGIIGLSYSKKGDKIEAFLKFVEEHGEEVFKEFGYTK